MTTVFVEVALGRLPQTIIHAVNDDIGHLVITPRDDLKATMGGHAWTIEYRATNGGVSVALEAAGSLMEGANLMRRWLNQHPQWLDLKRLQHDT